jgi:hypothetical protein
LAEFQEDAKNREKVIERMMQQGNMDRSRAEQAANKAEELTSLALQSIMGIISEDNRRRLRELENDPAAVMALRATSTMEQISNQSLNHRTTVNELIDQRAQLDRASNINPQEIKSGLTNIISSTNCSSVFNPAANGEILSRLENNGNKFTIPPQPTVNTSAQGLQI